jgi:hypothetical protein
MIEPLREQSVLPRFRRLKTPFFREKAIVKLHGVQSMTLPRKIF